MTCTQRCERRRRQWRRAWHRWAGRVEAALFVLAVADAFMPRRKCDKCGQMRPLFRRRRK